MSGSSASRNPSTLLCLSPCLQEDASSRLFENMTQRLSVFYVKMLYTFGYVYDEQIPTTTHQRCKYHKRAPKKHN